MSAEELLVFSNPNITLIHIANTLLKLSVSAYSYSPIHIFSTSIKIMLFSYQKVVITQYDESCWSYAPLTYAKLLPKRILSCFSTITESLFWWKTTFGFIFRTFKSFDSGSFGLDLKNEKYLMFSSDFSGFKIQIILTSNLNITPRRPKKHEMIFI